jgi:hypothetical protein
MRFIGRQQDYSRVFSDMGSRALLFLELGSLAAGATILGSPPRKPENGEPRSESESESEGSDAGGSTSRCTSLAVARPIIFQVMNKDTNFNL